MWSTTQLTAVGIGLLQITAGTVSGAPYRITGRSTDITYEDLFWRNDKRPDYDALGSMTFGEVPNAEPYSTIKFPNASELVLKPSVLLPEDYDSDECGNSESCCTLAKSVKGCQAWFDFFNFCFAACADDDKCTGVDVRMESGECALYDTRVRGCLSGASEESSESSVLVVKRDEFVNPHLETPSGFVAAEYVYPPEDYTPLKVVTLAAETCDGSFGQVREQNIADCAAACEAEAECTSFGYSYASDTTGDVECALYGTLKWKMDSPGYGDVFYVKNETVQCEGKKQYFGFTLGMEDTVATKGCTRLLKEGELCQDSYCMTIEDLTNNNHGCAPGLMCLQAGETDTRYCTKPQPFLEEAEKQLQQFLAFPGKALPRGDDNVNTTEFMFFDFSGRDWNYLEEAADACEKLCYGSSAEDCFAYELDREREQCIVAHTSVCATSLVENPNAVTIVDALRLRENERPKAKGFKLVKENYFPVLSANATASDNVRLYDLPCPATRTEETVVAMETECLAQCDQWEDCHTVHVQPWVPQCVMFAGDEGRIMTSSYHKGAYSSVYVKRAKLGCKKNEFYGILKEQFIEGNATLSKAVQGADKKEWEAVLAERGFGVNSTRTPVIIEGLGENECSVEVFTPGTAACIPYIKGDSICAIKGNEPDAQFVNLVEADYGTGEGTCEAGWRCRDTTEDYTQETAAIYRCLPENGSDEEDE